MKSQVRQTQTLRRSDYFRDLVLQPEAAKETRVFGLGSWLTGRFVQEWRSAMTVVWRQRRGTALDAAIGITPILGAVGLIGAMATSEALNGTIGPGRLVVVLQCCVASFAVATINVWDSWLELGLSSVSAMRALEDAVTAPGLNLPGERSPDGLPARAIRFESVSFSYGTGRPVFDGLDLEIPAGRSLAIVGENGAGKTTLVKLLSRLYDPTAGRITVDGVDLRTIDAAVLAASDGGGVPGLRPLPVDGGGERRARSRRRRRATRAGRPRCGRDRGRSRRCQTAGTRCCLASSAGSISPAGSGSA